MEKTQIPVSRAAFLRSLGLSGAALMSIYCLGGLTACAEKEDPEPGPGPGPGPGAGKVDFTLDLEQGDNRFLNTNGGFMYPKDRDIIVARTNAGAFVALSKICTHAAGTVTFEAANDRFHCPVHSSNFSTGGAVLNGPASVGLKKYNTALTGTMLRVFE
ncbi:MAG: Rieske (2Fe-2S) protein [Ferruginibacter sp.]|nr:Rieske (2Fe-2S) protein [Cytophagales bacterium]